jgi:signal transduction histidine kinase
VTAVPRALRGCLHLLVVGLLALVAVRALAAGGPHATAVTTVAAATGVAYAVGPLLAIVHRSRAAAAAWLTATTVLWLALLVLTADAVWLAFPLFFLYLHLLPLGAGLAAVGTATGAAVAGFAWHQGGLGAGSVLGPVLGAAVAVATVLGYQSLFRESERRRQLIDELTAARVDLARAEHTAGVLAERERLAREIHDTLAQGLTSIQLLLRAAERALPQDAAGARSHVEHARRTAVDNLAEARRFVRALTPPGLGAGSLPAALHRLCTTTAASSGLAVQCHVSGQPVELATAQEVALLRIAQSALANTVQHAGATRAELTLSYMDTQVALDLVDDGCGFDPEDPDEQHRTDHGGFGLPAMRARARSVGGTVSVESRPGHGTALAAALPLT